MTNFVAINVWDDSIDFANGWRGTITNALIVHSEANGNRCIEADNQGGSGNWDAEPFTYGTINNMTCITNSGVDGARGEGEGPLYASRHHGAESRTASSPIAWARGRLSRASRTKPSVTSWTARKPSIGRKRPPPVIRITPRHVLNSVVISCFRGAERPATVPFVYLCGHQLTGTRTVLENADTS